MHSDVLSGAAAWSLLDADLTQQTGHKLRLSIPETAVIRDGVLTIWLRTNSKTGVLQSVPRCQHSLTALLQSLKSQHVPYDPANPDGWVAVAHFSEGLSWLVDAAGLEQLLSKVYVGAVPEEATNSSSAGEWEAAGGAPALQMLQAYVVPSQDERFLTTFGGVEGPATTTHVRPYSQRYKGAASAASAQATVLSVLQQAHAHAQAAAAAVGSAGAGAGHSGARQHGSCTGSIVSLSAGLAVGEPRAWSEAAGSAAGQAEDFVGGVSGVDEDGDGSRDSRSSSGRCRGSCSSQTLSVNIDAAGCGSCVQLRCGAGAGARHGEGHDSVCETPTLGLATAAAIGRHQAAGLFKTAGHAHATNTAADGTFPVLTSSDYDAAGEPLSCSDVGQQLYSAGAACSSAGLAAGSAQAAGMAIGLPGRGSSADGSSASCEAVRPAPGRIAKAAAAAVQALTSYLDKGLGLRVQGLVAEFIQGPPSATNPEQQPLVLVGLSHLSLDPQQSRGGTTTFTERWGDFLAGTGPPPAPSPADHTTYGRTGPPAHMQRNSAQEGSCPAAHASCSSPCSLAQQPCAVFSPLLHPFLQQQHAVGGSRGCAGGADAYSCMHGRQSRQGGFGDSAGATAHAVTSSCLAQQLNRQFFPALLGGQHGAAGSQQQHWAPSRPLSAPRSAPRPASPHHTLTRPATASPGRMRTGSSSSGGGGCNTLLARQTAAAAGLRPGAGGNPVPRSSTAAAGSDSCRLWLQGAKPGDSLTAQLAAQLETAREQVQQYAEAADAAALTAHYAVTQAAQQVGQVQQELLQLRDDAAAAGHERRQLQQQISSLQQQRSEQGSMMQSLQQQLAQLQEQLGQDRSTLATMLRQHQEQEQQLQEELAASQQQAAELRANSALLSTRLDEESEVVQALRAQLVEYKLQMGQMQLQAKKGRTLNPNHSSSLMLRRPGSATPTGQLGLGSTAGGGVNPGLGGLWSMQSGNLAAAGLGGEVNGLLGGSHAGGGGMTRSGSLLAAQLQGLAAAEGALGQSGRLDQQQQRLQHTRTTSSEWQPSAAAKGPHGALDKSCKPAASPSKAGISTQWGAAGGSNTQQETLSCSSHTAPAGSGTLPTGFQWQGGVSGLPGASPAAATAARQEHGGSNHAGVSSSSSSSRASDKQPQAVGTAQQQVATAKPAAPAGAGAAPSSSNSMRTSSGSEPRTTTGGASTSSSSDSERSGGPTAGARKSPKAAKQGAVGPEAVVAEMVSSISADLGGSLAAAAPVDPPLLIGDLLVGPAGFLDPSAPAQLALVGGLLREVYGDLLEVFTYYAVLGKAQVVADRLTLELPQFGRLAYDLHLSQDNVTLSAIEDVFYLLSDRKPCEILAAEAAQAHAASHTRGIGSSGHKAGRTASGASGTAKAAEARGVQKPKDLMVQEQFPEALVRLACVRYRYGVVNWEYNWDESTDDESYYTDSLSGTGDGAILSPRTARMRQQQQDAQVKQGPKVLKPEGAALRSSSPGPTADSNRQRQSFSRPVPEPYKLPTESDDLATVVRTFLQHEVFKYGRRSKLAGSSLGIRRAKDKAPAFQGWQPFPAASVL